MAGKPIRLGKAAGELNVGLPTLVEFLESKGIKIDSNPNTRLEQEHFELLCQEFAADQSMKEQSKASTRREKRESVTLSDKPADTPKMSDSSEDEDEGDAINLEEIKRQVFATEKQVVVTPEEPKTPEVTKEIDHTPEITPVESNHVEKLIFLRLINEQDPTKEKKIQPKKLNQHKHKRQLTLQKRRRS
jgi:translation initiation factor IF-2